LWHVVRSVSLSRDAQAAAFPGSISGEADDRPERSG
jgi:hypothetical protein